MAKSNFISTLPVSLTAGLLVLAYGLYNFLTQWQFSEDGHSYLLIGYSVLSMLVFLCLRLSKSGFAIACIIGAICVLLYANQKFDWRSSYILDAQSGRYFAMEQYIDAYPTFEQSYFAWFSGAPRWVDFSNDCYQPLLNSDNMSLAVKNIGRHCKSTAAIQDFYRVDIRSIIKSYYNKMQSTAKLLEKGRLDTKPKFEKCIINKKCAMIPLLPAGSTAKQQSDEHLEIRKQFWSVRNDKHMSQQNCDFFDFCRIMVKAKIIKFDKI